MKKFLWIFALLISFFSSATFAAVRSKSVTFDFDTSALTKMGLDTLWVDFNTLHWRSGEYQLMRNPAVKLELGFVPLTSVGLVGFGSSQDQIAETFRNNQPGSCNLVGRYPAGIYTVKLGAKLIKKIKGVVANYSITCTVSPG